MTLESRLLWKSEPNTRRFARWLGIPAASFLPFRVLVPAVIGELNRKR